MYIAPLLRLPAVREAIAVESHFSPHVQQRQRRFQGTGHGISCQRKRVVGAEEAFCMDAPIAGAADLVVRDGCVWERAAKRSRLLRRQTDYFRRSSPRRPESPR